MKEIRRLLTFLENEVTEVEISDLESNFIMLKSDFMNFRSFEPVKKHSISLLPYEDPYVKGYKNRDRLVSPDIYDNAYFYGEAQPTILVDGRIVETWRFEEQQDVPTLSLLFMKKIEKPILNRVRLEAKAIGEFISGRNVQLKEQETFSGTH